MHDLPNTERTLYPLSYGTHGEPDPVTEFLHDMRLLPMQDSAVNMW